MIEVLDLDQSQEVRVVDVERRFSEQESSEISLVLELLAQPGVHCVNRVSSQEVVGPERKGPRGVGNTEVFPLAEILGNITVKDEEEGEKTQQDLEQHLGQISQLDWSVVRPGCQLRPGGPAAGVIVYVVHKLSLSLHGCCRASMSLPSLFHTKTT